MFQGTGERMTRSLKALAPFTMNIILVPCVRVVDVPVVMQQVPTFQGADTCGSSAGVVLCPRLFISFFFGHGGGLRVRGCNADLPSAPRTLTFSV